MKKTQKIGIMLITAVLLIGVIAVAGCTSTSNTPSPTVPVTDLKDISVPSASQDQGYYLEFEQSSGGVLTSSLDKTYVPAGTTVTFTVTPDASCEVSGNPLITTESGTITPEYVSGNTWKFVMPASSVKVRATFVNKGILSTSTSSGGGSSPVTPEQTKDVVIIINGETVKTASFIEAIEYVSNNYKENAIIKFNKNVVVNNRYQPLYYNVSMAVDLNGHTLTFNSPSSNSNPNAAMIVTNKSMLTFNSTKGSGKIVTTGYDSAIHIQEDDSGVLVDNGVVIVATDAIGISQEDETKNATVTIENGAISGANAINLSIGNVTVGQSGTVTGTDGNGIYVKNGNVVVNGTVTGTDSGITTEKGDISVTNATITGERYGIYTNGNVSASNSTIRGLSNDGIHTEKGNVSTQSFSIISGKENGIYADQDVTVTNTKVNGTDCGIISVNGAVTSELSLILSDYKGIVAQGDVTVTGGAIVALNSQTPDPVAINSTNGNITVSTAFVAAGLFTEDNNELTATELQKLMDDATKPVVGNESFKATEYIDLLPSGLESSNIIGGYAICANKDVTVKALSTVLGGAYGILTKGNATVNTSFTGGLAVDGINAEGTVTVEQFAGVVGKRDGIHTKADVLTDTYVQVSGLSRSGIESEEGNVTAEKAVVFGGVNGIKAHGDIYVEDGMVLASYMIGDADAVAVNSTNGNVTVQSAYVAAVKLQTENELKAYLEGFQTDVSQISEDLSSEDLAKLETFVNKLVEKTNEIKLAGTGINAPNGNITAKKAIVISGTDGIPANKDVTVNSSVIIGLTGQGINSTSSEMTVKVEHVSGLPLSVIFGNKHGILANNTVDAKRAFIIGIQNASIEAVNDVTLKNSAAISLKDCGITSQSGNVTAKNFCVIGNETGISAYNDVNATKGFVFASSLNNDENAAIMSETGDIEVEDVVAASGKLRWEENSNDLTLSELNTFINTAKSHLSEENYGFESIKVQFEKINNDLSLHGTALNALNGNVTADSSALIGGKYGILAKNDVVVDSSFVAGLAGRGISANQGKVTVNPDSDSGSSGIVGWFYGIYAHNSVDVANALVLGYSSNEEPEHLIKACGIRSELGDVNVTNGGIVVGRGVDLTVADSTADKIRANAAEPSALENPFGDNELADGFGIIVDSGNVTVDDGKVLGTSVGIQKNNDNSANITIKGGLVGGSVSGITGNSGSAKNVYVTLTKNVAGESAVVYSIQCGIAVDEESTVDIKKGYVYADDADSSSDVQAVSMAGSSKLILNSGTVCGNNRDAAGSGIGIYVMTDTTAYPENVRISGGNVYGTTNAIKLAEGSVASVNVTGGKVSSLKGSAIELCTENDELTVMWLGAGSSAYISSAGGHAVNFAASIPSANIKISSGHFATGEDDYSAGESIFGIADTAVTKEFVYGGRYKMDIPDEVVADGYECTTKYGDGELYSYSVDLSQSP